MRTAPATPLLRSRLTAVLTLAMASPAVAQAQPDSTGIAWREDLRFLATELPRRHKNAFARMTAAQWDSAVQALDRKLPSLKRHQTIVELMRLVALVGDGHTFLTPEFEDRMGFHTLPIRLYDFADGLYVIAADSSHRELLGARVLRIGRATTPEAMAAAATLVSHESPGWARFRGASLLTIPEVLAGLQLTDDPARATFTLDLAGREQTVTVAAVGLVSGEAATAARDRWPDMRGPGPAEEPVWLRNPGNPFWFTILPGPTLYIGYRAVQFFANGETNEQFFRRAFAAADSAAVERVIFDIRTNGGGNNFLNRFVVKEIIRRPALDQPDRLLVLIGRGVFSAAQNLVNELDFYTNATFVGEPTGNAPNQYGDARRLELPRSKLRIFVSSLYWQGHVASNTRLAFTPDLFVEATSADYRDRRDPVLETALRWATGPTLAQQLGPIAERGDTTALIRAIENYRTASFNRYRDIEADLNTAGYRLLRSHQTKAAISVFRANVRLFPRSGNGYDSLGEALERDGQREEAIAAYRQALALNANLGSSRDALRRLGATP